MKFWYERTRRGNSIDDSVTRGEVWAQPASRRIKRFDENFLKEFSWAKLISYSILLHKNIISQNYQQSIQANVIVYMRLYRQLVLISASWNTYNTYKIVILLLNIVLIVLNVLKWNIQNIICKCEWLWGRKSSDRTFSNL